MDDSEPLPAGLPAGIRRTVTLPSSFPDARIEKQFLEPRSSACPSCTWGFPNMPELRAFAVKKVRQKSPRPHVCELLLSRLSI
jgi:hypothetical protein